MILTALDWTIISIFFLIVLFIGWRASKRAGKSSLEFFLAGKSMPWWLLGVSMVATTFSADTPNLVTGFVREGSVAKNWAWWSFLITGMVTVFIYSRLWRRSGVMTDLEFYEVRYGGKAASFLRGFRALYLGIFFNCLIMGSVTLAAIKISSILFGISPLETVIYGSIVVVIYSVLGGIRGVIWTDFFQFAIALFGAIYAAHVALSQPEVGGLNGLINHPAVMEKMQVIPDFSNSSLLISMFIIPIAVQWWSVWYPGAEPGGGGYIAQRMLAAKDENHAVGATLFFNFAHYALRPWPWILVGLASLILYPDLASIKSAFPNINEQYLGEDIAYPVMLTLLGSGWLGLVLASLIAAFMSTISTHLNWGASYIVNDFYVRFVRKDASDSEQVLLGRIMTVFLMIIAGAFALTFLENASQAFSVMVLSGAGTGAVFLLRWFWWRINAMTEIVAMVVATIMAFVLVFGFEEGALANSYVDEYTVKLLLATVITSIAWLITVFVTAPESEKTLNKFVELVRPDIGWKRFGNTGSGTFGRSILSIFLGTVGVYSALFAVGNFLYGNYLVVLIFAILMISSTFILFKMWRDG